MLPPEKRKDVAVAEALERLKERVDPLPLTPSEGTDELGEELAETFVENATGADDAATEHRSVDTPADLGGPFVTTGGAEEFAAGTDASNPEDAEREAFPTVSGPPRR